MIIAAVLAIAEILLGFGPGHFIARDRAEPDAFLAFRPWLLVLAVFLSSLATVRFQSLRQWSGSCAVVAVFILLASVGEWTVLAMVGTPDPAVAGRSVVASLALGLGAAVVAWVFARLMGHGWLAAMMALVFSVGVLALKPPMPSVMHRFEQGIRPSASAVQDRDRPRAVLLTDLPLVWGEGAPGDVLGGAASPPAIYQALKGALRIAPVDSIDEGALADADVLILAQPRALRPAELVRIDDWVRAGHAALVFADPALHWAWEMPPQLRRPPFRSLLDPLLRHWGLEVPAMRPGFRISRNQGDGALFGAGRIGLRDAGMLRTNAHNCRLSADALMADCRIGTGRALVVVDADLLADENWVGPGPMGASRAARMADNDLFVVNAVRALAGAPASDRYPQPVRWITAESVEILPLILAALGFPLVFLSAAVGIIVRIPRR